MNLPEYETTVVADVGARYGVHPSWDGYEAPLHYVAFEPDSVEAARLRSHRKENPHFTYRVEERALGNTNGVRDFFLLKHRGLSSFLQPDLQSECFKHLKPGQAEIEEVIPIQVERFDSVFSELHLRPDFIKVDTEGTEQDVIEGAEGFLTKSILGIRSSCNFQPCFFGQKLFSQTHDYLLKLGFFLLNLDYKGFGFPRLGLFRKPDPIENEEMRYGILVAADAVWILKTEVLRKRCQNDSEFIFSIFKLAYFCLLNHAPDYAIDLLKENADKITDEIQQTRLYKHVRIKVAKFLGRYRTVPDYYWHYAQRLYQEIFSETLQGGSDFHPQIADMSKELQLVKS